MRKIDVLKNATLEETAEWILRLTMASTMMGLTQDKEAVRDFMSAMSSLTARMMLGEEEKYEKGIKRIKEVLESEAEDDKLSIKWFYAGCHDFEI